LAIVAWAILGIIGAWALDAASHPGGTPADLAVLKLPAWALFEIWAIGFVLLGVIGSKVRGGTRPAADRGSTAERPMRRTSWAILAWTVLWIVLVGIWALDPAGSIVGEGPGPRGTSSLKPPDWVLFDAWFLGFVAFGAIWLVTRWRSAR